MTRELELVEQDVRDGLISAECAKIIYGVVIGPDGVDVDASLAIRTSAANAS
jgi:N-methylhydantoinase B/oxoprolinase/acetone carboxylase alpha subunit